MISASSSIRAGLVLALCLCACAEPRGVDTVLLITIDDLRPDHLSPYGYKRETARSLGRLAMEGMVFEDAVTPSTARNAALVSLMTGTQPSEHGLLTVDAIGRHRLPEHRTTLAELFAGAGFRTIGVPSLRVLEGRLSGLDQGFSDYLDEDLPRGGGPLPAHDVVARLMPEWKQSLESGEPVFAWIHLGDLGAEVSDITPDEDRFIRRRLEQYADHPVLEREFSLKGTRENIVTRLTKAIGRRRGSPMWSELRSALYDLQLLRLEPTFEILVDEIRNARRYDDAVIAVVGTRGRYLAENRPHGVAEGFSEGVIRVPVLLKGPKEAPRSTWPDPFNVLGLHSFLGKYAGETSLPEPFDVPTAIFSSEDRSFALVDREWKSVWVVERGMAPTWIKRVTDSPSTEPLAITGRSIVKDGYRFFPTVGLGIEFLDEEAHTWTLALRTSRPVLAFFERAKRGPGVDMMGGGREVVAVWKGTRAERFGTSVVTSEIFPALVLELEADDARPAEGRVILGEGLSLLSAPVPRLPDDEAGFWEEETEPRVDVVLEDGWLAIEVGDPDGSNETGDVRIFAAAHPPKDEPLVVEETEGVVRESDPMLPDAAVLRGAGPLRVRVRARPRTRLALCVQVDGAAVPVDEIRYMGRRFAGDTLRLYFPPWLPSRWDWFTQNPEIVPAPSDTTGAWARISLRRRPDASFVEGAIELSVEEVRFLEGMANKE